MRSSTGNPRRCRRRQSRPSSQEPVRTQSFGPVWNGDFQSQYRRFAGHVGTQDPSTGRWTTEYRLITDPNYEGTDWNIRFGSAHPSYCHFSFVDGSVRPINNTIDFETYHRLSLRSDGLVVGDY